MEKDLIQNVSDTALWVAAYRAKESARPDAVFQDPLAAQLAGKRGEQIADSMPFPEMMEFALAVRTTGIDRLIQNALNQGIDSVLNLGAGVDTRPYRMRLPTHLHWIEVDLPGMIQYKNEQLKEARPNCHLERIALDITRDSDRKNLLDKIEKTSNNVLVISEGLIPYLSEAEVSAISQDLIERLAIRFWIQDYRQGNIRPFEKELIKRLQNAPFRFEVRDQLDFLQKHGWLIDEKVGLMTEAKRIGKKFPSIFPINLLSRIAPRYFCRRVDQSSGFVRLRAPLTS